MFKGLETVSFVMTTSRPSVREDDSFDQFFTLLDMPERDADAVLENIIFFVKDNIRKKFSKNSSEAPEISFDAALMAVKLWEQYFASRAPVEVITRWFGDIITRKRQRAASLNLELKDNLSRLITELEDAKSFGETSLPDLRKQTGVIRAVNDIIKLRSELSKKEVMIITADELLTYVADTNARNTGVEIDTTLLKLNERKNLLDLENILESNILGQNNAVELVSRTIRVSKSGLKNPNSPLGSFIFAGPTGVGKTELAKQLASSLGMSTLLVDMTEYSNRDEIARMIGAPPGYVGYNEGEGFLFEHMKKHPNTVLIFDEVEKAHPDIMNILLQVLEDGRLTSNRGDTVKFDRSVVILTSNMGMTRVFYKDGRRYEEPLGPEMEEALLSGDSARIEAFKEKMRASVNEAARDFFRPEFLNRVSEMIVFDPLPIEVREGIARTTLARTVNALKKKWALKDLVIGKDDAERTEIFRYFAQKGYTIADGARPMRKTVEKFFEDPLVLFMDKARANIHKGDTIAANLRDGVITFTLVPGDGNGTLSLDVECVLGKIATHLSDRPKDVLTSDDLEEMFGFRKEMQVTDGVDPEFTPNTRTDTTTSADFRVKDKAMNTVIRYALTVIPENATPVVSEAQGAGYTEKLRFALSDWIKSAVTASKMMNLESYIWEKNSRTIENYYSLKTDEPDKLIGPYLAGIGEEKDVSVTREFNGSEFKVAVSFNSHLTKPLHRIIFGTKYADKAEIEKVVPRSLSGLVAAQKALLDLGATVDFYQKNDRTYFWVKIPVSEGPVSASKPIATREPAAPAPKPAPVEPQAVVPAIEPAVDMLSRMLKEGSELEKDYAIRMLAVMPDLESVTRLADTYKLYASD
ncbi:MAG: ATP-dependent Clp protease ATP-binding subunit, partial [Candidatus Omnitrophica bacterium]|nr:ATP-dependent Clp protease ATP-binding subunit [Candidatus Omnitrophota bacterium]